MCVLILQLEPNAGHGPLPPLLYTATYCYMLLHPWSGCEGNYAVRWVDNGVRVERSASCLVINMLSSGRVINILASSQY